MAAHHDPDSYPDSGFFGCEHFSVRDLRVPVVLVGFCRRLLSSMCNLFRLCDQLLIGLLAKTFIILLFNSGETG